MQYVVIFGYFGCGNLGDETNLGELVTFLRQINPQLRITVISAAPSLTAKNLGVASIGKYDLRGIARIFRKADLLIGGGGSLFQDRSSLRSLFYYTSLVFLAGRYRLKIFLYGQGIGPLSSRAGKLMARWALSQTEIITVRDQLSQLVLQNLKVSGPAIHLTAEPLLLKNRLAETEIKQYWLNYASASLSRNDKLGLILQEDRLLDQCFWNRLMDSLTRSKLKLYLIATAESDWRLNQRLAYAFRIPILPVQNRWEMLQQAVGGLDMVVSSRLHGLVAAVVQGIPCYGLALDPKIEGFCNPLGIEFIRLTVAVSPLWLSNAILNDWKQSDTTVKPLQQPPRDLWNDALKNQAFLKQAVMSKSTGSEL